MTNFIKELKTVFNSKPHDFFNESILPDYLKYHKVKGGIKEANASKLFQISNDYLELIVPMLKRRVDMNNTKLKLSTFGRALFKAGKLKLLLMRYENKFNV